MAERSSSRWSDPYPEPIDPKMAIKPSLAEKLVDILEYVDDKDEIMTEQIVAHFVFNAAKNGRYPPSQNGHIRSLLRPEF